MLSTTLKSSGRCESAVNPSDVIECTGLDELIDISSVIWYKSKLVTGVVCGVDYSGCLMNVGRSEYLAITEHCNGKRICTMKSKSSPPYHPCQGDLEYYKEIFYTCEPNTTERDMTTSKY